jgi:phospholipase C
MSDLTKAFDFSNPDYSLPSLPRADTPLMDSSGNYIGWSKCESSYRTQRPTVPYGKQTPDDALYSENGFKAVRGSLTEGRYLVFEMNGYALANVNGSIAASPVARQHDPPTHRWVAHQLQQAGSTFQLSSAVDGNFIASDTSLTLKQKSAANLNIVDLGNGAGYTVQGPSGYFQIDSGGKLSWKSQAQNGFSLFSVTYKS